MTVVPLYQKDIHQVEIHVVIPDREHAPRVKIVQTCYVTAKWVWLPLIIVPNDEKNSKAVHGLFAVTGDDNQNMVISLSARQLNAKIRVIARCEEARNSDEDAARRRGLRGLADTDRRPAHRLGRCCARRWSSFLDVMLRSEDLALRIEELAVPASMVGRKLDALDLHRFRKLLLLAVHTGSGWSYNPPRDHVMQAGETLVFMGSPEEREQLEQVLGGPAPKA